MHVSHTYQSLDFPHDPFSVTVISYIDDVIVSNAERLEKSYPCKTPGTETQKQLGYTNTGAAGIQMQGQLGYKSRNPGAILVQAQDFCILFTTPTILCHWAHDGGTAHRPHTAALYGDLSRIPSDSNYCKLHLAIRQTLPS